MSRNAHGHFETWQLFLLDMQKLTLALQQIKVYHVHESTLILADKSIRWISKSGSSSNIRLDLHQKLMCWFYPQQQIISRT